MANTEEITGSNGITQRLLRGGGLASWSIRHPVGVVMITLAVMVLGLFALQRLCVREDLLHGRVMVVRQVSLGWAPL